MNTTQLSHLVTQLTLSTQGGLIRWQATTDGYGTKLGEGHVEVSAPVSDQRDGDFCYFRVFDNTNTEVAKATIQPVLYTMIHVAPTNKTINSMLEDLAKRLIKPEHS